MNALEDHPSVSEIALEDDWSGIRVVMRPDRPVRLHRYPVETVTRSEAGFECRYQGTCLVLVWPETIGRGPFEAAITLEITTR